MGVGVIDAAGGTNLNIMKKKSKSNSISEEDYKPYSRLPDLLPPAEIVEAAEKVRVWMDINGHKNWQLGGICDRRIASDRDDWRNVANGSLLGTIKKLDTALDTLKMISVSDWKTSGELRKMARDASQ